eukprot:CAMPEP_0194286842 /NCGR_PEP_ID=MMETSP0169-20130528/33416_1 /TAXON_ID=218684 /ORGANISM="Corethron pennatum, Strain L29A3" /LENGTH=263 /DNA_ID=CAMNT_0039033363 /DNA_START=56 /DNA_END=847 /DNA_ORIENTATION=+
MMFKLLSLALFSILEPSCGSAVIEVTGKNIFFYQEGDAAIFLKVVPAVNSNGCGKACEDIAPVWEDLAAAFADNKHYVIGELSCDNLHQNSHTFCKQHEISSYPTFLYSDNTGDELQTYGGPTDLESLKNFALELENDGHECSVGSDEGHWCSATQLALIDSFRTMPIDELITKIESMDNALRVEYEVAGEKVAAAQRVLDAAEANGDSDEIAAAKKAVEDVDAEFDDWLSLDQPIELTWMADIFDEREGAILDDDDDDEFID